MKRVLTAIVLVPPVVYVVLGAPWALFFAIVALCAVLSYFEYAAIASALRAGSGSPVGYAAGFLLLAWPGDATLPLVLLALVALVLGMRAPDLADSLPRAAFLLMGVVYVFGAWKCALLVRAVNPHWLMFALLVNWVGDAGAFYAGKSLGRHKLAPRVSPAKTWEGSAGSIVASLLLAGGYLHYFVPAVPLAHVAGAAIAANVSGQVGDLAESALKRGAGIKDSGSLLPGHGGFLDRVDSTLFALPVVYAYLRLM